MEDKMEKARAGRCYLDSKINSTKKDKVNAFLGIFYPNMTEDKKQKILQDVEE